MMEIKWLLVMFLLTGERHCLWLNLLCLSERWRWPRLESQDHHFYSWGYTLKKETASKCSMDFFSSTTSFLEEVALGLSPQHLALWRLYREDKAGWRCELAGHFGGPQPFLQVHTGASVSDTAPREEPLPPQGWSPPLQSGKLWNEFSLRGSFLFYLK